LAFAVIGIWLLVMLMLAATIHGYGQQNRIGALESADAIFMLGPALDRRVNHAADLWRRGFAPVIVCSGGTEDTNAATEAEICARTLSEQGIPAEAVILETVSISTEENAIFAAQLMREHGWQQVILVSDDYHLLRVDWIFRQQGINSVSSGSPSTGLGVGYIQAIGRELIAFQWQVVKDTLNLPYTHVEGI
jgi:uncharacterized SAM-binding protein YcdF (DUF218 family)